MPDDVIATGNTEAEVVTDEGYIPYLVIIRSTKDTICAIDSKSRFRC
jgi:hypothetical protein